MNIMGSKFFFQILRATPEASMIQSVNKEYFSFKMLDRLFLGREWQI